MAIDAELVRKTVNLERKLSLGCYVVNHNFANHNFTSSCCTRCWTIWPSSGLGLWREHRLCGSMHCAIDGPEVAIFSKFCHELPIYLANFPVLGEELWSSNSFYPMFCTGQFWRHFQHPRKDKGHRWCLRFSMLPLQRVVNERNSIFSSRQYNFVGIFASC